MPKGSDALVLITDGVEEMEYIVIVDVLLRCGVSSIFILYVMISMNKHQLRYTGSCCNSMCGWP